MSSLTIAVTIATTVFIEKIAPDWIADVSLPWAEKLFKSLWRVILRKDEQKDKNYWNDV